MDADGDVANEFWVMDANGAELATSEKNAAEVSSGVLTKVADGLRRLPDAEAQRFVIEQLSVSSK